MFGIAVVVVPSVLDCRACYLVQPGLDGWSTAYHAYSGVTALLAHVLLETRGSLDLSLETFSNSAACTKHSFSSTLRFHYRGGVLFL